MTPMLPSPFLSSAIPAETLPAVAPGNEHYPAGSKLLIDEEAFLYAVDPPPLPPLFISDPSPEFLAGEIETLLVRPQ
jgi:hypothetical protein